MSDVNVQLVREFFELNGFRVMTHWRHDTSRGAEHGLQLFVENTAQAYAADLDYVLRVGEVSQIQRALVEVRAWHADRFYASVVEASPVLFEVVNDESLSRAKQVFGTTEFKTILVISELPASPEARQRAVTLFQQGGISHIVEFPVILREMIDKVNANASYAPSHTLQTLRLLKRYDFIRFQQLEFPFPTEAPLPVTPPQIEAVEEQD